MLKLSTDVTTPGTPCDDFDGTTLYGPGALGSGAIGSNAQGAQAGDAPWMRAPARPSASG